MQRAVSRAGRTPSAYAWRAFGGRGPIGRPAPCWRGGLPSQAMLDLLAHGGHPIYDHPAMAAIAVAAMVIPLIVLAVIGRVFWRAAKQDERERPPAR
jgi:hypothetical protein